MKDHTEKYDATQKDLLNKARRFYNEMIVNIGRRLKPSVIKPGENPDSPQAVLMRGAAATTAWTKQIRQDILNSIPDAQDLLPPLTFALVCGVVLGEVCAINDESGQVVPDDIEDTMADVFEGGYILGRTATAQAIDRGAITLEKDAKGAVKVIYGNGGAVQ